MPFHKPRSRATVDAIAVGRCNDRRVVEPMTADKFRSLALSLPEVSESAHMGHPDFRVDGKIFATLGSDEDWGMVKLKPGEQASFVRAELDIFRPASGAWRRGSTIIQLRDAKAATVKQALIAAWRNTAPKRLGEGSGQSSVDHWVQLLHG